MNRLRIVPLDDTVVFPGMPVTLPVDVGGDDRVLLVPRARPDLRQGRRRRRSLRARAARRPRPRRIADGLHRAMPGARHRRRRRRAARRRRRAAQIRRPPPVADARARARIPRGRRGDPRAARRRRPHQRVRAVDHRRRARWPIPPATRRTSTSNRRSSCSRRSTSSSG